MYGVISEKNFSQILAFTLDDLIAKGKTEYYGNFQIAGHEHEISRITPKLNIYHDCNDWWVSINKRLYTVFKKLDFFFIFNILVVQHNFCFRWPIFMIFVSFESSYPELSNDTKIMKIDHRKQKLCSTH